MRTEYNLEERLIRFAIQITILVESLPETKVGSHLGGQLLRSGTSPALNYAEAQAAESRRDFIHKLRIVLKELRETLVCLRILVGRSMIADLVPLNECRELIAIFTKSIATATAGASRDKHKP